jgi:hypothetical protein
MPVTQVFLAVIFRVMAVMVANPIANGWLTVPYSGVDLGDGRANYEP